MKILLRETDGKVWALDPETGENLTTFDNPTTWCDNDGRQGGQGTGYAHPAGIYWNSWEGARRQLASYDIITDDEPNDYGYQIADDNPNGETPTINFIENGGEEPAETPIINRASFNPADMAAEDMTIRQVYKCAAMEGLITVKINQPEILANVSASIADAMIAEDRWHEESK